MSVKTSELLERGIRRITNTLAVIGGVMLCLMMMLGAADVLGRYFFNRPITGSMEISSIMMACAALFGLAYALVKGSHVNVEMVVSCFRPRTQAVLAFICTVLALVFFVLVTWQSAAAAVSEWSSGRMIDVIFVPLAPLYLLVTVGTFILSLELILQMLHLLAKIRKVE
jgi:TRAP-type C4-dicarboxylate transport system permease small subunit